MPMCLVSNKYIDKRMQNETLMMMKLSSVSVLRHFIFVRLVKIRKMSRLTIKNKSLNIQLR